MMDMAAATMRTPTKTMITLRPCRLIVRCAHCRVASPQKVQLIRADRNIGPGSRQLKFAERSSLPIACGTVWSACPDGVRLGRTHLSIRRPLHPPTADMKRIFRIGRFAPAEKSPQGNWIFSVRLDVGH